ncbi:hypothetical protein IJ541_06070 [bacterium]|nr:hypothetical protein [bacterium]
MEVRNNVQSPYFGMALRIKKSEKIAEKLSELPIETIRKIEKAGERLKDTQFYHVELGEDLVPRLVSKEGAYWGLNIENAAPVRYGEGDNIMLGSRYGISRLSGGKAEDGFVRHNAWDSCGALNKITDIDDLTDIALKLDSAAVKQARQQANLIAAQEVAKKEASSAANTLLSKFSVEG